MGRGNYCPLGKLTDQWYIDYERYYYLGAEPYNCIDEFEMNDDIQNIMSEIANKFKSFEECDDYPRNSHSSYWGEHIYLRNKLFEIGTADNEWSYAFFIREIVDEDSYGLAKKNFEAYRNGIQKILLNYFNEISLRSGAWMSRTLKKEDACA